MIGSPVTVPTSPSNTRAEASPPPPLPSNDHLAEKATVSPEMEQRLEAVARAADAAVAQAPTADVTQSRPSSLSPELREEGRQSPGPSMKLREPTRKMVEHDLVKHTCAWAARPTGRS